MTLTPLIRAKANPGPAVIVLSGCKGNTLAARFRAAGVRAVFYYPMQIAETNSAEATRSLLTGLFQGHTLRNAMRGSQQFLEQTEGLQIAGQVARGGEARVGLEGLIMLDADEADKGKTLMQILTGQ